MILGIAIGCVATALVFVSPHAFADPVLTPNKPLSDADPIIHLAIASLDRRISFLEQYKSAVFIGVTPTTTNGKFVHKTAPTGLPAAAALCSDAYGPGAHMCTVQEIYASSQGSILAASKTVPKSWIMPSATAGLADNCGSYTSSTGERQWTGTAFQWDVLPTGFRGPRFLGGADAACSTMLPIACCL